MKIAVAHHKVDQNHDLNSYYSFLRNILENEKFDLFIGPDYAISHRFEPLSLDEKSILGKFKELSLEFPNVYLLPGSAPIQISSSEMTHSAFLYFNGQETKFDKQTDHGEEELARRAGLSYVRGQGKPNIFHIGDKKVWLHICGDRGRKPESNCNDSDLEIIMAHDRNAGIHFGFTNPKNKRYVVLCDSYYPKSGVVLYDPSLTPGRHIVNIEPLKSLNRCNVYDLT